MVFVVFQSETSSLLHESNELDDLFVFFHLLVRQQWKKFLINSRNEFHHGIDGFLWLLVLILSEYFGFWCVLSDWLLGGVERCVVRGSQSGIWRGVGHVSATSEVTTRVIPGVTKAFFAGKVTGCLMVYRLRGSWNENNYVWAMEGKGKDTSDLKCGSRQLFPPPPLLGWLQRIVYKILLLIVLNITLSVNRSSLLCFRK